MFASSCPNNIYFKFKLNLFKLTLYKGRNLLISSYILNHVAALQETTIVVQIEFMKTIVIGYTHIINSVIKVFPEFIRFIIMIESIMILYIIKISS